MLEETTPDVLNAKGLLMFLRQSPSSETASPSTSPEPRPVATEAGLVNGSARSSTGSVRGDDGEVDVGGDGDGDSGGSSCDDGVGSAATGRSAKVLEAAAGNAAAGRALPPPVPPPAQPAAAAPLRVAKGWEEAEESVHGGGVVVGESDTPVPGRSKNKTLLSSPSSAVASSARGGGGGGDADDDAASPAVTSTLRAWPWGGGGGWTSTAVPVTPATPVATAPKAVSGSCSGSVVRGVPVAKTAMPMPAPRTAPKPRKPRFRFPVVTPSPSAVATTRRHSQAPAGFAAAHVTTPAPSSSAPALTSAAHQHVPVPVTPGTPSVRLAPVELFTLSPVAGLGGTGPASDASALVARWGSSLSTGAAKLGATAGVNVEPTHVSGVFAATSKRKEETGGEGEGTGGEEVQKRPRVATS